NWPRCRILRRRFPLARFHQQRRNQLVPVHQRCSQRPCRHRCVQRCPTERCCFQPGRIQHPAKLTCSARRGSHRFLRRIRRSRPPSGRRHRRHQSQPRSVRRNRRRHRFRHHCCRHHHRQQVQ